MAELLNIEGLVRSMQFEMMILIGAIIIISVVRTVVILVVLWSERQEYLDIHECKSAIQWSKRVATSLIVLSVIVFAWTTVPMMISTRIPREDIEKTPVYEQMKLHTTIEQ